MLIKLHRHISERVVILQQNRLAKNLLRNGKVIGLLSGVGLLQCWPLHHLAETQMPNKITPEATRQALHEIELAISGIQFGSVEITLHEGRVTQIERREKLRLSDKQVNAARPVRAA